MADSLPGSDNPDYFTLVLHVKETKGEWDYYDGFVELEGLVDVYVEHISVGDLRREFSTRIDEMQNKGKGVVIEEINEDANKAVPEIMCDYEAEDIGSEVEVKVNEEDEKANEFKHAEQGEYVNEHGVNENEEQGENSHAHHSVNDNAVQNEMVRDTFERFTMLAANFDEFFATMMEGTIYDVGNGYDKGRVKEGDGNDNPTGMLIDSHTEVRVEEADHSV
ncbi:hypothetical protein GH714_019389 [Hevea brasiliensis]|uniref:Uncharacterized protein n=1 Tax=Hevea brasiliensis TaxID=3981 RepID=A0A6A6MZL8_HEVBR|nr:hypothetical protein GH714_019317 [Hevea brasiliensis]KAF2317288.1 hypothetical protein GH714_019389 [Hevea brasiliensis]